MPVVSPSSAPTSSPSKLYCEPGYYRTLYGRCEMCNAGFYSNGTYSMPPNVTTECDPCPVGACRLARSAALQGAGDRDRVALGQG